MPVWYEATKKLREDDQVQLLGVIEEQHPDRCKLFMQWKQMDFPILVDSLDLLGVSVVPIVLGIDEHGVVRRLPRDPAKLADTFVFGEFPPGGHDTARDGRGPASPKPDGVRATADRERMEADSIVLRQRHEDLGVAIGIYDRILASAPDSGETHFHVGVAYRMRCDSPSREPGDFQRAIEHWQKALDQNPNQYIWRRRIQQYGPLLDKPYAFYAWVEQARDEIKARGETPIKLCVEPGGTELAGKRTFQPQSVEPQETDPEGRITRDRAPLINVETTTVPPSIRAGETARVHVTMRPDAGTKGHWNNEAEPLQVWLSPLAGWEIDRRRLAVVNPAKAVSAEPRTVEFEVRSPKNAQPGKLDLPGYALYYVCQGADGVCLYRRQDLSVPITIRE